MRKSDPNLCPLCGEQNHCGVSQPEDCWCRSETFSHELIESIPDNKVKKACICQNCVRESSVRLDG